MTLLHLHTGEKTINKKVKEIIKQLLMKEQKIVKIVKMNIEYIGVVYFYKNCFNKNIIKAWRGNDGIVLDYYR